MSPTAASSTPSPRRRTPQDWVNALLPSIIWLGGAGFYAAWKKPEGVSFLAAPDNAVDWLGVALFGAGLALHCWSVVVLASSGPVAGQEATLAVTGPYRFSRNPIYLAGITLLTGVGLLYGPWHVVNLALPAALFAYFHLAVVFVEEPALRGQFGERYASYCRRTSRWFSLRPPSIPDRQ